MLHTVNVIQINALQVIQKLFSYNDDVQGNQDAEQKFRDLIKNNDGNIDDEEIEMALEDGYYDLDDSTIIITHSTGEDEIS
jgi:hypothetical protein